MLQKTVANTTNKQNKFFHGLSTEVCFKVWSLVSVLVVQGQQLEDKALLCLYLRATGEVSILRYCIFLFSAHSEKKLILRESPKAWLSTQMSIVFSWNAMDSLTDASDAYGKGLQANCSETIEYCHTNTTQPSKFG